MKNLGLSILVAVVGCGELEPTAIVPTPEGGVTDVGVSDGSADSGIGSADGAILDDAEPSDVDVDPDASLDASLDATVDSGADGGPASDGGLTPCPTTGMGAITAPAGCVVFTPVEAGAASTGDNAADLEYALSPVAPAKGALVLFLNASLASPARQVGDPVENFYNAAANSGFHVLAIAYRSSLVVGITCSNDGPCFALAREAIVTGVAPAGAPSAVANIQLDEGILARLDAALRLLATSDPSWSQFFADPNAATPEARIAWGKVIATGHSQGGGHAAYLGKLFPLRRVVQLSSTCDAVGTTPAPWTNADATWATSPADRYVGFGSAGDTICAQHVAVWQAMGLDASRQFDDAEVCGGNVHGGSIGCVDNFPRWPGLLE